MKSALGVEYYLFPAQKGSRFPVPVIHQMETDMNESKEMSAFGRQVFNNSQFGELRVSGTPDRPMFCLNDVCKALGLENTSRVKARLNDPGIITNKVGVVTGTKSDGTPSVQQVDMLFIDEPNLYRCIFQSRKKEAQQFQDWVFNEVLPSIRKSGGYIATQADETPEMIMARALKVAERTIEEHEKRMQALAEENEQAKLQNKLLEADNEQKQGEIRKMTPFADYAQQTLLSKTTYNTNLIAKEMGMSAKTLNQHLKRLGIQYKQHDVWVLTSKYVDKGYTKTTTYNYTGSGGELCSRMQMEWTERGRAFIHWLHKQGRFSLAVGEPNGNS